MTQAIAFTLNGQPAAVEAAQDQPLLDVLRGTCGLAATRLGCGLGQCGACTVLLDEQPVQACATGMAAVAGRSVTTLEGLGTRAAPHPLQQAFIDEQALQCGFCTSGMLMRAAALLRQNPSPTDDEIRAALEGQLCRCGVHNRVLRAVRRACT